MHGADSWGIVTGMSPRNALMKRADFETGPPIRDVFSALVWRIEANEIIPLDAESIPLRAIAQAQESLAVKGCIGKIVLEVS